MISQSVDKSWNKAAISVGNVGRHLSTGILNCRSSFRIISKVRQRLRDNAPNQWR
ncbi:hypothetical protein QUA86_07175 [Microcoleus sp. F6_B6]